MKKVRNISIALAASLFLAACAQAVEPSTVSTEPAPTVATEIPLEAGDAEPTAMDESTQAGESHTKFEEIPFASGLVAGGVRRVEAASVGDSVRWILPGLRALDPAIFGTPELPLGFEPGTGLPLEARLVSEDGTTYTTTANPTPFSDNFALIEGSFNFSVVDISLVDGPDSQDQVEFSAAFSGPDGKEYAITLLKVIPMGPDHPFFGGVATNIIQHGATGIGTNLMPGAYTYVAFWGVAELSVDGEVVASNRIVHGMVTSDPRDEEYKLGFDQDVDNSNVVFHLILPNTEVTPDGPQKSPVPTGFILPNGVEQPFFHVMFDEITLNSALVVDTASGNTEVIQEVAYEPGSLAGGPIIFDAAGSDDVRWILPGLRALDPAIFGTPELPLGFEPGTGLPLEARLVSEDGTTYTTTANPTPFSDNFALIEGSFNLSVVDISLVDGPDSQDQVEFSATFSGPDGKEYAITLLKVIPMGPDHPFFGGVATNIIQHGATRIGTNLMPGAYTYVAFWGVAELSVDGEVVASNRIVHGMVTSNPRDEEYKLGFDQDVDNSNVVFHLILPNTEVTPDGPQKSPVPTGFILPNGAEQPFFHIMFDEIQIQPALVVSP